MDSSGSKPSSEQTKPSVAIVGGGIGGLSAGYFLRGDFDVTLFEQQSRLGGNAYTFKTSSGLEADIAVAAFGKAGYPNFFRLLKQLGVQKERVGAGFVSVQDLDTGEGFYISPSPRGLAAQRFALLRPGHLLTLIRLPRGLRRAFKLLRRGELAGLTMREALKIIPQFRGDAELILICTLCLLSSMSGDEVYDAPAEFFFEKLAIHNDVMSPRSVYSLYTVPGGTQTYINALAEQMEGQIELGSEISQIRRTPSDDGVTIVFEDGTERRFDKLVLACNADQALALLKQPSELERELLTPWRYKDGALVLHRDHSSFPPRELTQAFTFLYRRKNDSLETSVNGSLRFLAGVPNDCDLIGSQHPNFPIDPDQVEFQTVFRTPIFDFDSCATTKRLPELNGTHSTYYCGSHFGHGLHEDAVSSALAVADSLGAEPWS